MCNHSTIALANMTAKKLVAELAVLAENFLGLTEILELIYTNRFLFHEI